MKTDHSIPKLASRLLSIKLPEAWKVKALSILILTNNKNKVKLAVR